jgi:hypothetical protein
MRWITVGTKIPRILAPSATWLRFTLLFQVAPP